MKRKGIHLEASLAIVAISLAAITPAFSAPVIVALKNGSALTDGGQAQGLDPKFTSTNATVIDSTVHDTSFVWHNKGPNGSSTTLAFEGDWRTLIRFDLAAVPNLYGGGVVHKAQIRLRYNSGNTGAHQFALITSKPWDQAVATLDHPMGNPPGGGWANDIAFGWPKDVDAASAVPSTWGFNAWLVADVTAHVQAIVAANGAGYLGWATNRTSTSANLSFRSSEHANDGERPVLFIEYTPIPEPSTAGFLIIAAAAIMIRRYRHCSVA